MSQAPKTVAELKGEAADYVRNLARRVAVEDAKIIVAPGHLAHLQTLAWLDPDALTARMGKEIEARDSRKGIASAERATKLAMLADDLLAAERLEEALVSNLEPRGMLVERSRSASPAAILGVQIAEKKAAAKAA